MGRLAFRFSGLLVVLLLGACGGSSTSPGPGGDAVGANRVVPSVVGSTEAAARSSIVAAGLTVGSIGNASSATVQAGRVISQNPAAGLTVAVGSAVDLVISTGGAAVNLPPVASIARAEAERGYDALSVPVRFDGSGSYDPERAPLTYEWTLVSKPYGSWTAAIAWPLDPNRWDKARPTLIPDYEGEYRVRLRVNDGTQYSAPVEHVVTAARPTILAKLDRPYYDDQGWSGFCMPWWAVPGGLVGDSVKIRVSVPYKTFDVSSVTATIAGKVYELRYAKYLCLMSLDVWGFETELALAGWPPGPYPVSIRATDVSGNFDQFSFLITHDKPPALTVLEPRAETVAYPSFRVDASCTDDLPNCQVWVSVMCDPVMMNKVVLSGVGSIKGMVDTSACANRTRQQWSVSVAARDSAGQTDSRRFDYQ